MSFLTKQLAIKYAVRVCHMLGVITVSGKAISDYYFNENATMSKSESIFYSIMGVIMILGGTINTFLQKPKVNLKEDRYFWMNSMYFKFILTCIIFTPIPKLLGFSRDGHVSLKFYSIVLMILLSPILRFYREHYTEMNKQKNNLYVNMEDK